MRRSEAINFLNLKYSKSSTEQDATSSGKVYIPLGKKLISFSYPQLEKTLEIEYTDEILDFHIFKENQTETKIILIAKSNKTVTIYKENGDKENE